MLHGEIKVNDIVIGTWEAANQGDTYLCHMTYTNQAGYPLEATFTLNKGEPIGAPQLAAKVLAEGYHQLRRKITDYDRVEGYHR